MTTSLFPHSLFSPFARGRVSQDGQFLHYIFPYQFMDSPEWESLRPSEEGVFQVIGSSMAALPQQYPCFRLSSLLSDL